MDDNYESLCKDILHELNIITAVEVKIHNKTKKLIGLLRSWNRRNIEINKQYLTCNNHQKRL